MTHDWPSNLGLDPVKVRTLEQAHEETPGLASWIEGVDFVQAGTADRIAGIILPVFHHELANARIAYLFKEKSTTRGRSPLGKTNLLSKRDRFLSDYDFVIVFDWSRWKPLTLVQRVALVDHQLEHCGVDDNGNFIMIDHDIREFNTTVRRWGAWQPNVRDFFRAAKVQFEMFEAADDAPAVALEQ